MTTHPIRRPDLPTWDPINDPANQNGPCDRAPVALDSHAMECPGTDRYRCVQCRRTWDGQTPNFMNAWNPRP